MNILLTGGAGYVGSILCPLLLAHGHTVRVLDRLHYSGDGLLSLFRNPDFSFTRGDIRNWNDVCDAAKGMEMVIHLAAVVGYPACSNDPELAKSTHVKGTTHIASLGLPTIFASTQSVYGSVKNCICTERTELNPLSLYADGKVWGEDHLNRNTETVILRFPTLFGLSPRMRLDLLVNDFTYKALTDGYIVVYQPQFTRAFLHVYDAAWAYLFAIAAFQKMKGEAYNVGSTELNYTKRELCGNIQHQTKCALFYQDFDKDKDKRDYKVSCEKIAELGYHPTISLYEGIKELIRGLPALDVKGKYANA